MGNKINIPTDMSREIPIVNDNDDESSSEGNEFVDDTYAHFEVEEEQDSSQHIATHVRVQNDMEFWHQSQDTLSKTGEEMIKK